MNLSKINKELPANTTLSHSRIVSEIGKDLRADATQQYKGADKDDKTFKIGARRVYDEAL